MKTVDFEYDGVRLSDVGFQICSFDFKGRDTVSNGSVISFNTSSTRNGVKYELTSSVYEECLSTTFQICRDVCAYGDVLEISVEEIRNIMRWLNRKNYHKLRFFDNDGEFSGIYFMASFNVSKIEINGKVYGFELEMFTNRPFALQEPITVIVENDDIDEVRSIVSRSDDESSIYPNMQIVMNGSGDLDIYSITEDRHMVIKNCSVGEVINIDYPIITTSLSSHNINNDFNWVFFRIATSFKNKETDFTVSLPCTITLTYSPIVKVSI